MFFFNIALPLITGALLASAASLGSKIKVHQIFYWFVAVILVIQVITVRQIKGGYTDKKESMSFVDLRQAFKELLQHKTFVKFLGGALFFYLFWQADWTLYFLGQVNYLKMNEAWLSYAAIGAALAQFLTIGFWSRLNERKGPRFGVIFGNLGLAFCSLCMIISTGVPLDIGPVVFLILNTIANLAFATVPLNMPQYLLSVIPENNKTLSISIYPVCITLSNAIMPLAGVKFYQFIGNNLSAFRTVSSMISILHIQV
jgi:Na+/melibiose symporter-like transporter